MPAKNQQFLSAREVSQRYGIGIATVWRWASEGVLPPPVKIGPRATRWSIPVLEARDAQLTSSQAAR